MSTHKILSDAEVETVGGAYRVEIVPGVVVPELSAYCRDSEGGCDEEQHERS